MIAVVIGAAGRLVRLGRLAADAASSVRVVVSGDSMEPALSDGDRVLVSRAAYRFGAGPSRGDIVLLRRSVAGVETLKRVAAGPGDSLPDGGTPAYPLSLSHGEYWVLGDNRDVSRDSRAFGPVGRHEIAGRAWYRYAPGERAGLVPSGPDGA